MKPQHAVLAYAVMALAVLVMRAHYGRAIAAAAFGGMAMAAAVRWLDGVRA